VEVIHDRRQCELQPGKSRGIHFSTSTVCYQWCGIVLKDYLHENVIVFKVCFLNTFEEFSLGSIKNFQFR